MSDDITDYHAAYGVTIKGSWLPAKNMGPAINTDMQESSPKVTLDGKYLFFTRGGWKVNEDGSRNYVGKRFWVDSQIIETLKPK